MGLGVAVLVVVISVMNGFDAELHRRILGTVPHVVLVPPTGTTDAGDLGRFDPWARHSRFFEAEGMVARSSGVEAVAIYGVDAQGIAAMDVGDAEDDVGIDRLAPQRAVGSSWVHRSRCTSASTIGDPVTLVLSSPTNDSIVPRLERFTLSGRSKSAPNSTMDSYSIGLDDVMRRGLAPTGRVGVRLKLAEPMKVDVAVAELAELVPAGWQITDWRSNYGELFRAVRLEKSMMFMLLVLIVAIAAFNIVSAQTMLVNEKRSDIAILRTMGASEGLILRLVLVQGVLVALAGIGFGLVTWARSRQSRNRDGGTARIVDRRAAARRHVLRQSAVGGVAARHRVDRGGVVSRSV